MRVPVHCSICNLHHRTCLRDLPDGRIVCPYCEHGAQLPEEGEMAAIERLAARERLLTVVGASLFVFAIGLTVAYAALSDAHPGEALFGLPLVIFAGVLGLVGLVVTVLQESKASLKVF